MLIRDANSYDIPELTILMDQLGYPTTEEKMAIRFDALAAHPSYHTLIAESDGKVVGMAGLCLSLSHELDGYYVRLVAFVVDLNYRRIGIGKRLLLASEEWAKDQGASAITLNSGNREERKAAHQFYIDSGYASKSTGFIKKLK